MSNELNSQFLLDTLARFEEECKAALTHRDLVELFCVQIIPFLKEQPLIEPLRIKWSKKYKWLLEQVTVLEKAALEEVIGTFRQIEGTIGKRRGLAKKIARINGILLGNPGAAGFTSWPLYRNVFFEVKELLEMILKRGGRKICKNYAVLGVRDKYIDGSPKVKKVPYIMRYTFAPSVEKADQASSALYWDRVKDPAINWRYFESALWYWHTSESYFEQTSNLLKKNANPLPALGEKLAWLEIAMHKNHLPIDRVPTIFTNQLFKEGLYTIVNEITAFISNGCQLKDSDHSIDRAILELHLNENELWVVIHLGLSEPCRFYLKRFNDGANGSRPYKFIQSLLHDHADGGEVLIDFADISENIPKVLERIGMRGSLRNQFFGRSRGDRVMFHGNKVAIPRDEKCRFLLEELNGIHCQAGSPEYIDYNWAKN